MRPARRKKGSQGYRHFLARAPSDRRETAHPLRGTQGTLCPWVLFSQTGLRLGEPWQGWGAGCDTGLQRCTQSTTPTPALRGPWGGQEGESLLDSLSLSYANSEGRMGSAGNTFRVEPQRWSTRFYPSHWPPFSTLPAVPSKHPLSKDKLVTEEENPQSLTACTLGAGEEKVRRSLRMRKSPKKGFPPLRLVLL